LDEACPDEAQRSSESARFQLSIVEGFLSLREDDAVPVEGGDAAMMLSLLKKPTPPGFLD
jgi:hypothetical protein